MEHLRLLCDGCTIGPIVLPPFELRAGQIVSLQLPTMVESRELRELIAALSGDRNIPGLRRHGPIIWADEWQIPRGLLAAIRSPRAAPWFAKAAAIPRAAATELLRREQIDPSALISALPGTPRRKLAILAAQGRGPTSLVYATGGLDPLGRAAIHQLIQNHVDTCPAIHLSLAYTTNGRMEYEFPPAATIVEVELLAGAAAATRS